jgi:hypothetical protein
MITVIIFITIKQAVNMMTNTGRQVRIGDWIKGKSKNGELIHGYIEHVNGFQNTVKARVIACDNEEMIGRMIELSNNWVEPLPISMKDEKQYVLHLIDLALATKDKEWFMELSTQLNSISQTIRKNDTSNIKTPTDRNRLWASDITEV